MSPLAVRISAGVLALLALLALRRKRWAYLAFVVLGLLYFPAQAQFRVHVPRCELLFPTMPVVMLSLQNYMHIALFAGFYWMSWVQFRRSDARIIWALLATLLVGALVEVAEGMTGQGRCRVRDLVPVAAGALGAALLLAVWSRLRRKPAYVRIVRPRPAGAPPSAVPPRRVVVPPRGVVPPPPDFSPSPGPVTSAEEVAPTEEVAVTEEVARPAVVQRLRAILQRLLASFQSVWAVVLRRRRTIVVGVVILALVGAAAFVIVRLQAPAPVVTEAPKAAPPPPRPLQSEAEGYYEPAYQFTVSGRRFTRLTLRPEPFVTFSRTGTRQEAGCEEARIGRDAVHLRCELHGVGMVTIDGRFTTGFVTSRLDAPVLSAVITVTNTRGETLYRARDSFYWHAPD